MPRGKFTNVSIYTIKGPKINDIRAYLKKLEKDDKVKRRKKIKTEIKSKTNSENQ